MPNFTSALRSRSNSFLAVLAFTACFALTVQADSRSDAEALFTFAEQQHATYFSPPGQATQELEGYLVRYYPGTNTYLGTRGQEVYVHGSQFGVGIMRVGVISDFINASGAAVRDITDVIMLQRSGSCAEYAGNYSSAVTDIKRSLNFAGTLEIAVANGLCTFTSNNIPNHDFGNGGNFATPVAAVAHSYSMTATPTLASAPTALTLEWDNAVMLNGVKVDIWAAACYGVGDGKIGCNNPSQAWRYDPMSPRNSFGTDDHNAHTQPTGAYHYHGNPKALFNASGGAISPVVGFAADGFPILGSYFDANGVIRKATSSYRLKAGSRPTGAGNPGGTYDGTYRDDYEYVAGLGDLDRCNGMTVNGQYGYYITDNFPYMMFCFSGTPHTSFNKLAAGARP